MWLILWIVYILVVHNLFFDVDIHPSFIYFYIHIFPYQKKGGKNYLIIPETCGMAQVLLLDEVTVDLDVVARMDLLDFLKEECEQVCHVPLWALKLCYCLPPVLFTST